MKLFVVLSVLLVGALASDGPKVTDKVSKAAVFFLLQLSRLLFCIVLNWVMSAFLRTFSFSLRLFLRRPNRFHYNMLTDFELWWDGNWTIEFIYFSEGLLTRLCNELPPQPAIAESWDEFSFESSSRFVRTLPLTLHFMVWLRVSLLSGWHSFFLFHCFTSQIWKADEKCQKSKFSTKRKRKCLTN